MLPSLLIRTSVAVVAAGVVLAGAPAHASTSSQTAGDERRRVVSYVVRPGDTATELAVRFHAWTAELLSMNRLGHRSTLYVGQRLRIPVVPRALRAGTPAPRAHSEPTTRLHQDPSRARVARVISRTAARYGVDRQLALAISWQEAGWQMRHVSSAGAIGAMQVMPDTGLWMSLYVGRPLQLHRLRDNVAAGVMLIRVLRDSTGDRRAKIAAYYQGLGAVRREGVYAESRQYVANVLAIKRRLENGEQP